MTANVMMMIIGILGLGAGLGAGIFVSKRKAQTAVGEAKTKAEEILAQAKKEAENLIKSAELEGKDKILEVRSRFDKEKEETRKELQKEEKRLLAQGDSLLKRTEHLNKREDDLQRKRQSLQDRERNVSNLEEKIKTNEREWTQKLEQVANMTAEEAKRKLLQAMESEARHEGAKLVRRLEEEAKEKADSQAKKIISQAIERIASPFSEERAVTVVNLPNDEMKGRIIGREGRNIRALEAATGVDLIIDDTPEAVVLSAFNPVRREVARLALEELIADGRIHPVRIEEVVSNSEKKVSEAIKKAGEEATFELGIHNLHPELIKLMGALRYRYSYSQNILKHSIEVGFICGIMAAELGLNVKMARRAGFLHDIGKALTHEVEGAHALIGADLCRKYRESPEVCHAVAAHHEDIPQETAIDCLVDAADALSGARPGARREVMESYIKRLEDLEKITTSFEGVERSFAIQAGREVRVMVDSKSINDDRAAQLSREIANKIETEMTYPGQIRVTVIRETRAVEVAK